MVTHDMILELTHTILIVAAHDPRWAQYGKLDDKNFCFEDGRLREV